MKKAKDFLSFQKWFTFYQKKLGLDNYKVYFTYEPLEEHFAEISINQEKMVATVRLNSKLPDKDKPFKNVKENAQHEAVHLLVGRLEARAYDRYVMKEEIYEAVEELVRRIQKLVD